MLTVLVLHGPNLHLLGQREKTHYGSMSLEAINDALQAQAKKSLGEWFFVLPAHAENMFSFA